MKIAIIHDWLTGMRGGEKCLEVFCELFPKATIFTLLHNKGSVSPTIENMEIKTSFIQMLPAAGQKYRSYLPLFPKAIEGFDLKGYDLVLSSSHCAAKGAKIPAQARHICYCYTPMRYAWLFFNEYFGKMGPISKMAATALLGYLRRWDLKTNESVDFFVAISDNVKERIRNFYKRDADVIYPPVNTEKFSISKKNSDFFLIVSALVPYKRIDIAIEAFNRSGKKLIIIGNGNSLEGLKAIARPNIEFLGWADDDTIADYYMNCRALIFPGEEDFGIVPVEAQACGKPVIAYAKGGVLETVIPINGSASSPFNGSASSPALSEPSQAKSRDLFTRPPVCRFTGQPTGMFFYEQTPQALSEALEYFEKIKDDFDPQALRDNALRFDRVVFKKKIEEYIRSRT